MKNFIVKNLKGIFAICMILVIGLTINCGIDLLGLAHGAESLAVMPMIGFAARDRAIFNFAKSKYPGYNPAPSFLRVEATLNTNNTYSFRFQNVDTVGKTERKLDRNDVFVMSNIALLLSAQNSTTIGTEILQSYPNALIFTGNSGADATSLETIYAGKTQLKIADRIELEAFPNLYFRNVPTLQKRALTTSVEGAIADSSFNVKDCMYELPSLIDLQGSDDATLTVDFPALTGTALTPGSNITYRLVFFATGFLLKGAAAR
ncbi:MAG: hypothetical protein ACOYLE_10910 [Bacteroidales bacterium]